MRFRNSWTEAIVEKTEQVAANVMQLKLKPTTGTEKFTVGSHIDISILINGIPEIRSYSLVGQHYQDEPYTIAVKRLPSSRGGSIYMWQLKEGDKIKISQPTNHFELSHTTNTYLLIAGGIGITPILGMAEQLAKREDRKVQLLYLGYSEEEMPFIPQLRELLGNRLVVHCSEEHGMFNVSEIVEWVGPKTQVYQCGPIGLMNAVQKVWEASSFDNANLRYETFGASGLFTAQEFTVKLPRFKKELKVKSNQTLLSVLEEEGLEVMYDCKKGECGLCQVDILEYSGDIDHRDFFFSEDEKGENKKMCACVSRVANGNIVIDTAYRGK